VSDAPCIQILYGSEILMFKFYAIKIINFEPEHVGVVL
jgi:hypothetical protein